MEDIRHKIVLVDDNMATLNQGKSLLQELYRVYTVQSPVTFFENLENDIPDLILLDVEMPEMNGFEVIKRLKVDVRYRDIPVIFLTVRSDEESEREGFKLGAVDYITKPFSGPLLQKRVLNQILYKRVQLAVKDYSNNIDAMVDEIAETNKRLKIMLDSLPICCQLFNSDFIQTDCNEEAIRLFGFKNKQEYLERHTELYPEYQPDGQRSDEKIKLYLKKVTLEGRCSFDWTYRMLDGTVMPAETTFVRLNYGDDFVIAGYTRDLREHKRMTARIEAIINNLPGMVFQRIYNPPEYIYTFVSEGCKDLLGYTPEELIGNGEVKFLDMVLPEYIAPIEKLSAETFPRGLPYETTFQIRTKYGAIKWIWERSRVVEKNAYGTPYLIEGYFADITERQQLEAAEMANRAKSAFLANMSHEMRSPMNVVVGLTDLMLEEDDPSVNLKDNLEKINTAGNTLLGLINDVLDISKIEAGKLELIPAEYEVPSLLNDIITLNMIRTENKPVVFRLDINENLPYNLYGDDLRVKQIINNLLSNAFKYTQKGTVTLGINCEREGAENVRMSVWVSDTGIGIPEGDLKKLFTDYNQVDVQANRQIGGTGLGLSITKMLVENMNGEISVESEYNKGSTFRLHIIQKFVSDKGIGAEMAENLRSFQYPDKKKHAYEKFVRSDLSYANVLVVDDMPNNLDVAKALLGKYKMRVDCVTNGQDAIDRIEAGEPVYDAIFMDHMMPGMDGVEATGKIRAIGTKYAVKIPIIALTANAIAGNEQMFLSNDFQGFLAKPINIMNLDSIVQRWVRDKSRE